MHDLRLLDEIGADLDPPVAEPPDRLRRRVLSGMAAQPGRWPAVLRMLGWRRAAGPGKRAVSGSGHRVAVPGFGRRAAVPRVALIGGLAVALTAGLIAAQTLRIGDHAPTANAQAAEVLQFAALAAQKQPDLPARPGQFVFVETITAYSGTAESGGKFTTWIEPKLRRIWRSVDGNGDGVLRERAQAGGAWEETPLHGCRDGKWVQEKGVVGAGVPTTNCDEALRAYLGDLPTGTDAMYRYLYKNSQGGKPRDVQAFITVGDLIRENYVRPKAMAAMLNAAAKIPGATVIRDVADAAGRQGVAVAQTSDGIQTELIFDPNTYAYLGERTVAVKDGYGWRKGDVTGSAARLRIAIVDRAGEVPQ